MDDRPANNEFERKWLRPHGIVFDSVVNVSVPIPISRATTSIAALSGGSNRATALSLNAAVGT